MMVDQQKIAEKREPKSQHFSQKTAHAPTRRCLTHNPTYAKLLILTITVFNLIHSTLSGTFTEISSITVATGKLINSIAIHKKADGAYVPIYLTMDDPFLKDAAATINSNTTYTNPLDVECFDGSDICITAGNLEMKALTISGTEYTPGEKPFKFLETFKEEYKVLSMQVEPIIGTEYFLAFITARFGVLRYKTDTFEKFGKVDTLTDVVNDRFARGLLHIRGSAHGLASVYNVNKIFNFDVTKMEKIGVFNLPSGKMAELTLDRSSHSVAIGGDNSLSVFKYSDGSKVASMDIFYFVADIASIDQSNFILTAEDNLVKFYVFDGLSVITEITSYNAVNPIYAIGYNEGSNQIVLGGLEVGKIVEVDSPNVATECHPSCTGGCTKGFSAGHCTSCATGFSDQSGKCRQDSPAAPELDQGDFSATKWSEADTGLFSNKSPSIFEQAIDFAKEHWMWFAIGFGSLCLLCIL
jgi:hypothetical protein